VNHKTRVTHLSLRIRDAWETKKIFYTKEKRKKEGKDAEFWGKNLNSLKRAEEKGGERGIPVTDMGKGKKREKKKRGSS